MSSQITVSTRPRWAQAHPADVDEAGIPVLEERMRLLAEAELQRTRARVFVVRAVDDATRSITLTCDRAKLFDLVYDLRTAG